MRQEKRGMKMGPYDDIQDLERPVYSTHPRMPRAERAKQFMPFAALRGYDDLIEDRQTLRIPRRRLSEDEREVLDARLRRIEELLSDGHRPMVTAYVFAADPRLSSEDCEFGGYRTISGRTERVNTAERLLKIDRRTYSFDLIDGLELHEDDEN